MFACVSQPIWLTALEFLAVAAAAWGAYCLQRIIAVGAAYKAKVLCSAVFVSGRDPASVLAEDVAVDAYRILRLLPARVDRERRTATVSFLGLSRTAAHRPGLGATLALPGSPEPLSPAGLSPALIAPASPNRPWPEGEGSIVATASERLEGTLSRAFAEPKSGWSRRTRALVILRDGGIVAER